MPSLPNRNNRKKRDRSETLIIPHITKEMLEKARSMADQGASRAEIERAIMEMQAANKPAEPAAPPDPHRIVPTSRPRLTDEERAALREQMLQEQAQPRARYVLPRNRPLRPVPRRSLPRRNPAPPPLRQRPRARQPQRRPRRSPGRPRPPRRTPLRRRPRQHRRPRRPPRVPRPPRPRRPGTVPGFCRAAPRLKRN